MRGVRVTPKQAAYTIAGLLALLLVSGYAAAIWLERTAPVHPVTGFHTSLAGSLLFFAYPVLVVLQSVLLLAGIIMAVWGAMGAKKYLAPGLLLLAIGAAFALLNYIVGE
ncbi:MAG TPA: hypothetical protein VLA88_03780 [Candidatus Saccharimonadales bacterium]|nr:hypothetical protein [Candidatus Saccharimonadales bacterium]